MHLRNYVTDDGVDVVLEWLSGLRDRQAKSRILLRLDRLKDDNFGSVRPLREGVWELKIDVGPGYRVYYARAADTIILLLCGGDKRSQNADITRAVSYWENYQQRIRRQ
jgi:putative addiction module killer protein